jgi:DNA-binding protein H-NS
MRWDVLLDDQFSPTSKWFVICLAIVTVIYAVIRPMFKKKDPLDKPPFQRSLSQQRSVERQMQNVLVELAEMSRQITAQLDTRSAKLEALLREADQKLAALRQAVQQSNSSETLASPDHSANPAPPPQQAADPQTVEVYTLADQGRTAREIAQQLDRPSGEIELILALRR